MNLRKSNKPSGWGSGGGIDDLIYRCPHCQLNASEAFNQGTGKCPHPKCGKNIEKSAQSRAKD